MHQRGIPAVGAAAKKTGKLNGGDPKKRNFLVIFETERTPHPSFSTRAKRPAEIKKELRFPLCSEARSPLAGTEMAGTSLKNQLNIVPVTAVYSLLGPPQPVAGTYI